MVKLWRLVWFNGSALQAHIGKYASREVRQANMMIDGHELATTGCESTES